MKTLSSELAQHLAGAVTTLAHCWRVQRRDGGVLGFTSHDRDITFDGVTYVAGGGMTPSAIESSADLAVDNLDVEGYLEDERINERDLVAGRYDGAEVEIFLVNWADLSQGRVMVKRGHIGEVRLEDGRFVAELRGLTQRLQQTVGSVYAPECAADLADQRCGVTLSPPVWQPVTGYPPGAIVSAGNGTQRRFLCVQAGTSGGVEPDWTTALDGQTSDGGVVWQTLPAFAVRGTLAAVAGRLSVTDSSRDEPDGWFQYGLLRWTTGANAGLAHEVKGFAGGVIELTLPTAADPAVGDAYELTVGCDKRLATCRDRFANVINFRGFPHMPGHGAAHAVASASA